MNRLPFLTPLLTPRPTSEDFDLISPARATPIDVEKYWPDAPPHRLRKVMT